MAQQANHALPAGFRSTTTASSASCRSVVFRSFIWRSTAKAGASPSGVPAEQPGVARRRRDHAEHLPGHAGAFRYGMKCFFEEGRALAKMSHPNVVRVLNFFRANDTVSWSWNTRRATLQEYIQRRQSRFRENFLRNVARVLNGLREVHTHKLLHLDLETIEHLPAR